MKNLDEPEFRIGELVIHINDYAYQNAMMKMRQTGMTNTTVTMMEEFMKMSFHGAGVVIDIIPRKYRNAVGEKFIYVIHTSDGIANTWASNLRRSV